MIYLEEVVWVILVFYMDEVIVVWVIGGVYVVVFVGG